MKIHANYGQSKWNNTVEYIPTEPQEGKCFRIGRIRSNKDKKEEARSLDLVVPICFHM